MNPFDFVNAITVSKEDLMQTQQDEKSYNSFLVNRALSYFPDTIMYANEMNKYYNMPKKWQFDFLRLSISKRKRFSKWHKPPINTDDVKLLQDYYKYSQAHAIEALKLLNPEQLDLIKQSVHKGGTKNE